VLYAARLAGWILGCVVVTLLVAGTFEHGIAIGVIAAIAATAWLVIWLPRSAHRAFEAARYKAALRRYRLVGRLAFTARRARAALLSRSACQLAAGHADVADELLASLDPTALDTSERVVWLNNRACAALDAGRDPSAALALVEDAIVLRPDVPAVQHTRARALLALGRLDDAIGVLEAMRAGGELSLRLEAERCRELAAAWERKGQRDYADDYRDRARLHAPHVN
jgi:predicted Zn-dependent protease